MEPAAEGLRTNLRALRRARGLSVRALARSGVSHPTLLRLEGVSRDALSHAERSDGRVSDATWRRLALAVPVETIRPTYVYAG